jgi:hypothetical protein
VGILKDKVEVARNWHPEVGDFAFHPDKREMVLQELANPPGEFAYRVHPTLGCPIHVPGGNGEIHGRFALPSKNRVTIGNTFP